MGSVEPGLRQGGDRSILPEGKHLRRHYRISYLPSRTDIHEGIGVRLAILHIFMAPKTEKRYTPVASRSASP